MGASLFGGKTTRLEINEIFMKFNKNFQKIHNFKHAEQQQSIHINTKIHDILHLARLTEANQMFNSIELTKYKNTQEFINNIIMSLSYIKHMLQHSLNFTDIQQIKNTLTSNFEDSCTINKCLKFLDFLISEDTIILHQLHNFMPSNYAAKWQPLYIKISLFYGFEFR